MDSTWEVIYQNTPDAASTATVIIRPRPAEAISEGGPMAELDSIVVPAQDKLARSYGLTTSQVIGFILLALGLGGAIGPLIPALRLESAFAFSQLKAAKTKPPSVAKLPASAPVIFNPLVAPDGSAITPVNTDFSVIIPKIGVNAPVIPDVDPTKPVTYDSALLQGVAQASTSYTPDQNGTTYLFSHSTNYDWFVKDLNAVFYLLKNLTAGDYVVVYYKGKQYTYQIKETKIVNPKDISYLVPVAGQKRLILETCWPPGSTTQRLLLFADLIQVK